MTFKLSSFRWSLMIFDFRDCLFWWYFLEATFIHKIFITTQILYFDFADIFKWKVRDAHWFFFIQLDFFFFLLGLLFFLNFCWLEALSPNAFFNFLIFFHDCFKATWTTFVRGKQIKNIVTVSFRSLAFNWIFNIAFLKRRWFFICRLFPFRRIFFNLIFRGLGFTDDQFFDWTFFWQNFIQFLILFFWFIGFRLFICGSSYLCLRFLFWKSDFLNDWAWTLFCDHIFLWSWHLFYLFFKVRARVL